MRKDELINKISGLSGFLIPIISTFMIIISILQNSWFNWQGYAISDLGRSIGSPIIFNNGIILTGFLLLIFSLGVVNFLKKNRYIAIVLIIGSFFLMGAGVFPLPSFWHIYVSSLFFVLFTLFFLLFGIKYFRDTSVFIKKMSLFSIVIVLISLFSLFFLFVFEGIAITEFLIIIPGFFWCMVFGVHMFLD